MKKTIAMAILLALPLSANAFMDNRGTCQSNECLASQIDSVKTKLIDIRRHSNVEALGYFIYIDAKRTFIWKSGILEKRIHAGVIVADFRSAYGGNPTMIIFDADGTPK